MLQPRSVPVILCGEDLYDQRELDIRLGDLEACSAYETTGAEALAEVERAKAAWLAAAEAEGKPIPEPRYRAPHHATS